MPNSTKGTSDEIEKAYGGCHKCYGKGYATVRGGIIGYEDFGGEGFKSPPTTKIKYCTCSRGKQLELLIAQEANKAVEKYIIKNFGKRCKTKDTTDFPELKGKSKGRCLTCQQWDWYDQSLTGAYQIKAGSRN